MSVCDALACKAFEFACSKQVLFASSNKLIMLLAAPAAQEACTDTLLHESTSYEVPLIRTRWHTRTKGLSLAC